MSSSTVRITDKAQCQVPTSEAVLYLWNKVRVDNAFKREGIYEVGAAVLNRVRLRARYRYWLRDDGIETELLNGPLGVRHRSKITVNPLAAGKCEIEVDETLGIPILVLLMKPLIARVQRQLVHREVKSIAENATQFFALPAA